MDKAGMPTGVPAWFLRELRGFKDFKGFKVFSGSAKSNKFVLLLDKTGCASEKLK